MVGAPAGIRTRVHGSRGLEAVATTVRCRLEWASMRSGFIDYMRSRDYSAGYAADLTSYLDRCVIAITGPGDIISIFSRVKAGKRHLWLAFRVWFNYLEALGFDQNVLSVLRKSLPKGANTTNPDLKVPDEKAVKKSVSSLDEAPRRYKALYDLLIDSGLRLVEAIDVVNNFKADEVECAGRFYRVEGEAFRGMKQAPFCLTSMGE